MVGQRKLPFSGIDYYARAPRPGSHKNEIFNTIWLPVNASNRVIVDRQQDIMHMNYSGVLRDLKESKIQSCHRVSSKNQKANSDSLRNMSLPVAFELTRRPLPKIELELKPSDMPDHVKLAMWKTDHNNMAPFASLGKPT